MARLFDILGPTMVGPSSSHTAGACRLGLLAQAILGGTPEGARIGLHGSFAMTGGGHKTKRAMVGGLLGFQPDDPRLRDSFAEAREAGLVEIPCAYRNATAAIQATAAAEAPARRRGDSLGLRG